MCEKSYYFSSNLCQAAYPVTLLALDIVTPFRFYCSTSMKLCLLLPVALCRLYQPFPSHVRNYNNLINYMLLTLLSPQCISNRTTSLLTIMIFTDNGMYQLMQCNYYDLVNTVVYCSSVTTGDFVLRIGKIMVEIRLKV